MRAGARLVVALAAMASGCACSSHGRPTPDVGAARDAPTDGARAPLTVPCSVRLAAARSALRRPGDPHHSVSGWVLGTHVEGGSLFVVTSVANYAWGDYEETFLYELATDGATAQRWSIGRWRAWSAVWDGRGFLVRRDDRAEVVDVGLDGAVGPSVPTDCTYLVSGDGRAWCAVVSDRGTELRAIGLGGTRFVPATLEDLEIFPEQPLHGGSWVDARYGGARMLDAAGLPRGPWIDAPTHRLEPTVAGLALTPPLPAEVDATHTAAFSYFDRDGRPTRVASPLAGGTADVGATYPLHPGGDLDSPTWTRIGAIAPDGRIGPTTVLEAEAHVLLRDGPLVVLAMGYPGQDDGEPSTRLWLGECR